MDFISATASFETWLRSLVPVHEKDLAYKHDRMADAIDPFPFFRGTYYRWLQNWPKVCPELTDAPKLLAAGDLHVENFGTWRDAEGRLAWGVNDFDEAAELPYTNDLVRLATSVRLAQKSGPLDAGFGKSCRAILTGYVECLEGGGHPFVLEERHPDLRAMAMSDERDPVEYWAGLTRCLENVPTVTDDAPTGARAALTRSLPAVRLDYTIRFRTRAGMGSLGKPRFILLAEWAGGWVAREAKRVTPPANAWALGGDVPSRIEEIVGRAVRCADPYYQPDGEWVSRRLAARCSRIELTQLADLDHELVLLKAMGMEAANVHLGNAGAVNAILDDLSRRPAAWLEDAARSMAKAIQQDWKDWRKNGPHGQRGKDHSTE